MTASTSAARRFAAATLTFEKARLLARATVRQHGRQTALVMQARCAHILGGASSERAFAVGVVSTLIQESAQLIKPYREYSRRLLAIHTADPVLARAARDTPSVASSMAQLAGEDSDPCQIAQGWRANGWARDRLPELANYPSASTLQTVSDHANAASQRLTHAGISDQITRSLTVDINPIAIN
jgi:hypothetical protein